MAWDGCTSINFAAARVRAMIASGIAIAIISSTSVGLGQQACPRIMVQDSTLNNLIDPPGYNAAPRGTLGDIKESGTGAQAMILIPGLGFGGDVFDDLMSRWGDKYHMYAVTLAGFGGTAAPPCPSESTSFGEQTWTNGAMAAIGKLIADENMQDAILVGHWLAGTQIAVRLAAKHPERFRAVVIVSGSARMVVTDTSYAPYYATPEKRIAAIDKFMAPRWFKTVTRETWDDNNFLPGDYAVNPLRGLRLWRQAEAPKLHVWVRYLCEFNAQDLTLEMDKLTVPTLIVKPGLEGLQFDSGQNYMLAYTHTSWDDVKLNPKLKFVTIPDSRACLWFDQPERFDEVVAEFLGQTE